MKDGVERLCDFIEAREAVRVRKEAGEPAPWTDDLILQTYRFCNIRRNDDLQTRLIHNNWLAKRNEPDMWFAMCVARLVNWWPSLQRMKFPGSNWDPEDFVAALEAEKVQSGKSYTGAYMVRADAHPRGKAHYHAHMVLSPLWTNREVFRPRQGDTLNSFHSRLMSAKDFGSFLAAQVVADLKYYTKGAKTLVHASDWATWAASGPGSRRGLNRVFHAHKDTPWKNEQAWRSSFNKLLLLLGPSMLVKYNLTGQDVQNCLCEFDKYERVRLDEGRPRSTYIPSQP